MNARRYLAIAAVLTIAVSGLAIRAGVPAAAAGGPQDAAPRGPGRPGGDGLQLEPRARPRHPRVRPAGGRVRPALRRHRGHSESGDGAPPVAHRAVAAGRARAELRVRPARAREAAPQGRRPRGDARPHAQRERHDDAGRGEGQARQLQQRPDLEDRQRVRHGPRHRTTSASPNCRRISTAGRRWSGNSRTAAAPATASRRPTWPAGSRGRPTTC